MKKVVSLLLVSASLVILILVSFWLISPPSVPLNHTESQPIQDILAKSREVQSTLICDRNADINILKEIYIDSNDYELNKVNKLYFNIQVRREIYEVDYLSSTTRYILWDRSIHDNAETATPPRITHSHGCEHTYPKAEISLRKIAIRDNLAVVEYRSLAYQNEAILMKLKGKWFIASIRILSVSP